MTYIKTVDFFQWRDHVGFTCVVTYDGGRVVRYRNRLPRTVARCLCENSGYTPETVWERELVSRLTDGVCHPGYSWEEYRDMYDYEDGVPF